MKDSTTTKAVVRPAPPKSPEDSVFAEIRDAINAKYSFAYRVSRAALNSLICLGELIRTLEGENACTTESDETKIAKQLAAKESGHNALRGAAEEVNAPAQTSSHGQGDEDSRFLRPPSSTKPKVAPPMSKSGRAASSKRG